MVGTAGWNYKDWYNIFYPEKPDKQFKELDFLANYFDMVEINSSFYKPPNSFMANAWLRKVAHNPNFEFTAKLWQRFTHNRQEYTTAEIKQFTEGIDPLAEADKLGALLCQFPWSFKNTEENRKWLAHLTETFKDYPLVVEVRHASWDTPQIYEFLENLHVGTAAVDQPVIGKSLSLKPIYTGNIGYIRNHGRNYQTWFPPKNQVEKMKPDPSSRYDYLYSEKEITQIAEIVKQVAKATQKTFVVQNNHPRGQAPANATQLKAALGETILKLPENMFKYFPKLKEIAEPG